MKYKHTFLLLLIALSLGLTACSSGKKEPASSGQEQPQTDGTTVVSGFLVEDASKYVTLGSMDDLSAVREVSIVTDEEVEEEILYRLMAMAEYVDSDQPAEYGDLLNMNLTIKAGDAEPEVYEDYAVELGSEEFGPEFDEALLGKVTGESVEFSVTYDEDSLFEDWIGQTVSFTVKNIAVMHPEYPELTDEYARDVIGFDTADDYRAAMKEALTRQYNEAADEAAIESLFTDITDQSTFDGYPEDLYASCADQRHTDYESFAEAMGMTLDELYKEYQMNESDVEEEIMIDVNRKLLISALCQQEKLDLTWDEYHDYLETISDSYGYEDVDILTSSIPQSTLMWMTYEHLAGEYLLSRADVTDIEMDYSADDLGVPYDLSEDEGEDVIYGLDEEVFDVVEETETE